MSMTHWNGLIFVLLSSSLVQGQQISASKCSEYRNQTIKPSAIIPLTPIPKPIIFQLSNCSKAADLIVGGEMAKITEFPHQALLGWPMADNPDTYDFRCGGSLISLRYVMTAAHCLKSGDPIVVRLGEHNLEDDYDHAVDLEIQGIVRHPKYKPSSVYNDIALIELKEDVRLSQYIRPACLWTGFMLNVTTVIASGFGYTEYLGGQGSSVLRKVMLDVLDTEECATQFSGTREFKRGIIEEQICIGSIRGGKDTCQGDSGGPIQVVADETGCVYHVVGVTSTGSACGVGRSAAVYTRVASYIDWIEMVVWNNVRGSDPEPNMNRVRDNDAGPIWSKR